MLGCICRNIHLGGAFDLPLDYSIYDYNDFKLNFSLLCTV